VRRARRGDLDVGGAARLPVRAAANFLRDGARWAAAVVGGARPPGNQDSRNDDDHHRRLRRLVGAHRRRRGNLRPDEHRHVVRLHAGQRRRARAALQGARTPAAVPGAAGLARVRAVGRRVPVHHVRAAEVGVGTLQYLAPHRPRRVLRVRLQPQQAAGGPRCTQRPLSVRRRMGSLNGVRVLDLTRLLPGAYATLLLADLGAEVIKIEDPRGGDGMRTMGSQPDGRNLYFERLNRNKRSVTLDLRKAQAAGVLDALAAHADVMVDSFRPSTARRLGVDPETIRSRHVHLVSASISGFGASGPYVERAAHDINYQALGGLLRPPTLPGPLVGDIGAGVRGGPRI